MVFSSVIFLFFFLLSVYLMYWICPSLKGKNAMLILASLFFYAFGEPVYILLMIGSILANYVLARLIAAKPQGGGGILALTVVFNIGMLVVFKYSALLAETTGQLLGVPLSVPDIALPIGISFYTFQAFSYCIDVYRDRGTVQLETVVLPKMEEVKTFLQEGKMEDAKKVITRDISGIIIILSCKFHRVLNCSISYLKCACMPENTGVVGCGKWS